jgi:hypothetical protein
METENQLSGHVIGRCTLTSKAKFDFAPHHVAKTSKFACLNGGAIWLRTYHGKRIRDCRVKSTHSPATAAAMNTSCPDEGSGDPELDALFASLG